MKSQYRLKKNYQYNYVYKHQKSVADKHIVLLYCSNNSNANTRVGFSVSKKQGNAVRRNRLRRQLKSAMSSLMLIVNSGYNIILLPRHGGEYDYHTMVSSIRALLHKAGISNVV